MTTIILVIFSQNAALALNIIIGSLERECVILKGGGHFFSW